MLWTVKSDISSERNETWSKYLKLNSNLIWRRYGYSNLTLCISGIAFLYSQRIIGEERFDFPDFFDSDTTTTFFRAHIINSYPSTWSLTFDILSNSSHEHCNVFVDWQNTFDSLLNAYLSYSYNKITCPARKSITGSWLFRLRWIPSSL